MKAIGPVSAVYFIFSLKIFPPYAGNSVQVGLSGVKQIFSVFPVSNEDKKTAVHFLNQVDEADGVILKYSNA